MALLDADTVEALLHSSSTDKGIERTMEKLINELEIDSMYIIHYEEGIMEPEMAFEWDNTPNRKLHPLTEYVQCLDEWYHFEDEDIFVCGNAKNMKPDEKKFYEEVGYSTLVEYRMTNHGNVIGYMVVAWNAVTKLSDGELDDLHVIFKLMNDMLCKEFFRDVMDESEESLYKSLSSLTKTALYMIDVEGRITYANGFAKENYKNIKLGDNIYTAVWGEKKPKTNLIEGLRKGITIDTSAYIPHLDGSYKIGASKVRKTDNSYAYILTLQKLDDINTLNQREIQGKRFIFAMRELYKDIIAVEIRKDRFYNLLATNVNNQNSYSMDFVLKWSLKLHSDDKQKFIECFDVNFLQNAYMQGERKKEIDFRYRTHEGVYHCMNAQILFEQNTNKDIMVYILFQDVEQVKSLKIEEQNKLKETILATRSAAELKGQVLANISHEIRMPLSGITSMASVARQVYKDETRLLECLDNIEEYSQNMTQVMDELLEVVRVDNNSINIANQPFRLTTFLKRVDVAMRENIESKNLHLNINIHCQYNQLMGDEIRLQQIIYALINNAVSYTPVSGTISLTAKQVATDKKKVFVRFMIDDSGSGLTDKMKDSIFGHGSTAPSTISEEHFDLSLAAKLVNLMGGQIGVRVDGTGTHLDFTLPFDIPDDAQKKNIKKKEAVKAGDYTGRRLLLAEDSDMGRDALSAVLEVVGFEVDAVDNGRQAVIEFVSKPAGTYDAILMDIRMPFMDGREAARCIRISGKEDGESVPIIALSADTYESDIDESIKAGMQIHLCKPIDVNRLYKELDRLMPEKEK